MKKLLFLAGAFIAAVTTTEKASAQNITVSDDTTVIIIDNDGDNVVDIKPEDDNYRFRIAGYEISVGETARKRNNDNYSNFHSNSYFGLSFAFGFSNFMELDYPDSWVRNHPMMDLNVGKSIEINVGLPRIHFGFGKRHESGIRTGLNFVWNNYTFAEKVTLKKDGGVLLPDDDITSDKFEKSKLTTFGLRIPLEINIAFSDLFSISAGVFGQANLKSYTKVKYPVEKQYNMYINPFSYGFSAKLGFSWFSIYADYTMTELFKEDKGPETNVLTVGLSFGF